MFESRAEGNEKWAAGRALLRVQMRAFLRLRMGAPLRLRMACVFTTASACTFCDCGMRALLPLRARALLRLATANACTFATASACVFTTANTGVFATASGRCRTLLSKDVKPNCLRLTRRAGSSANFRRRDREAFRRYLMWFPREASIYRVWRDKGRHSDGNAAR